MIEVDWDKWNQNERRERMKAVLGLFGIYMALVFVSLGLMMWALWTVGRGVESYCEGKSLSYCIGKATASTKKDFDQGAKETK